MRATTRLLVWSIWASDLMGTVPPGHQFRSASSLGYLPTRQSVQPYGVTLVRSKLLLKSLLLIFFPILAVTAWEPLLRYLKGLIE